jgi:hypothetical protein
VYRSVLQSVKRDGFLSLFRGAPLFVLHQAGMSFSLSTIGVGKLPLEQKLAAFAFVGTALHGVELVALRLALRLGPAPTTGSALAQEISAIAARGVRGIAPGLGLSLFSKLSIPITAHVALPAIPKLLNGGPTNTNVDLQALTTASLCLLVPAVLVPAGVVQQKLMVQGFAGTPLRYRNAVHAVGVILKQEGPVGLFRGTWPLFLFGVSSPLVMLAFNTARARAGAKST